MSVEGLYLSRYQGEITAEAVGQMIGKKVGFVGIRLTSGAGYVDQTWEHNAAMLRDTSILLFPWHFVTTDDASKQCKNFLTQAEKFDRWRLPPALDCEGYTSVAGVIYSESELATLQKAREQFLVGAMLDGGQKFGLLPNEKMAVWDTYDLAFPTEATIDVMGRWLTVWMVGQPALAKFMYPAIYSACWCSKIFKTAAMKRYLGWWASWNTQGKPPLTEPCIPSVWKGTPYYIWQDGIIDGQPYGIPGQVSHEVWGPLLPFPNDDEPEPPPDDKDYIDLVGAGADGSKWAGRLTEE